MYDAVRVYIIHEAAVTNSSCLLVFLRRASKEQLDFPAKYQVLLGRLIGCTHQRVNADK